MSHYCKNCSANAFTNCFFLYIHFFIKLFILSTWLVQLINNFIPQIKTIAGENDNYYININYQKPHYTIQKAYYNRHKQNIFIKNIIYGTLTKAQKHVEIAVKHPRQSFSQTLSMA